MKYYEFEFASFSSFVRLKKSDNASEKITHSKVQEKC